MGFRYNYVEIPEFVQLVFDGNVNAVSEIIQKKKSMVNKIFSCKFMAKNGNVYDDEKPAYVFAIKSNNIDIIKLFIENGANLNDIKYPSVFYAIHEDNSNVIKLLVKSGAKLDFVDSVGKSAYDVAFYDKYYHLFSLFWELGLSSEKYGGKVLKLAAMNGNIEVAKFFVENGADINCQTNDMVFPNSETPVIIASRHNNFEMVKWLCEHRADVTLKDKYGDRPYTSAIKSGNKEIAEYLKNLEPADWHNEQKQIDLFKKHKVPKELVEFLKSEKLKVKFSDKSEIEYIEFFEYADIQEAKFKRKSILPLTVNVDNYSDIMLVWSGKEKAVCYIDTEHEEFAKLSGWDEFFENAESYMERIIDGEFNN